MNTIKKLCFYIISNELKAFKLQHKTEIEILKWEKNLIIRRIWDWRRWMSMCCNEVNTLNKADKQIQKVLNEILK